jgi:NADP-dependent 3-hydroxy acid dehydrogenase YdfG
MHTIKEKSVILTGCSSGIGKATAVLLKENGWRVFATARNQKDVDQLVQKTLNPAN